MASALKPEFVAVGGSVVVVGCSEEASLRLDDPSVSVRHAEVQGGDRPGRLLIRDLGSESGTFVNELRVRAARVASGDRVRFGASAVYRVEPGGLRWESAGRGTRLTARQIALAVPRSGVKGAAAVLVRDLDFAIRPDAFVGILGPSGAGKSTLLNCLAGYAPPAVGRLLFDGHRDAYGESEEFWALLGHVPQDDLIFRSLTVRENLAYSAALRLGGGEAADSAVREAVGRVRMDRHVNKRAEVLSGGQRKRLSVAVELLRRPRLLLLDEPTSGLDPASEARVMEDLKALSRQGTTVVVTTHLMENIALFDEVIVLGAIDGIRPPRLRRPPRCPPRPLSLPPVLRPL